MCKIFQRKPWRMSIMLQLLNGLSSKVCTCACTTLGNLEREMDAHNWRVGEATSMFARIEATKGQLSILTNSYGSLAVTCVRWIQPICNSGSCSLVLLEGSTPNNYGLIWVIS